MANKNLFSGLKSLLPRADARNEAGGLAYRLTPKHALAQLAATGCFNGAYYAEAEQQLAALLALVAAGGRQPVPGQAGRLQPRARLHEGHAGRAAGRPVAARPGPVPPRLRARRGQRPRAAHAVPDDPLRPVRPQEPVVRAPARLPALAERRVRRPAAVGVHRQRPEPARRAAPGPADADRQRPPGAVRLADRQGVEKWAPADAARPAGRGPRPDRLPRGRDGGGAGRHPGARRASAGTCWPTPPAARPSGRRSPARWAPRRCA